MTTLYANPYDIGAPGFFFEDADEFLERMEAAAVEEFSIEFIDGDSGDARLFRACGINQGNVGEWFEDIEPKTAHEKAALYFLLDSGICNLAEALNQIDDVCLFQGTLLEAATELFDECYVQDIPERLRCYIDYEAFANDCRCGGDLCEFEFDGQTWACTNANGL